MENNKDEKPGITDQLRQYIETRVELARLQAIEKGTSFAAALATEIFVLICIANQTGVDLTDALQKNLDKKTKRDSDRHNNNEKLS